MTRNRLAEETSPYLLQHAHNPVHWMSWSGEAFQRAKQEDKPILLSIGYAACHWCHVMAHESFEDHTTADLMNAYFINIKVDREERPDIDRIYMTALQAIGEQGGWPLTMFLDTDGHPFWGGTYFPPESRYSRPSFKYVLQEIARLWREERSKITANTSAITTALQRSELQPPAVDIGPVQLRSAAEAVMNAIDPVHGGLKGAPKFPQAPIFSFLWIVYQRFGQPSFEQAVVTTLRHICQGGIYDHLGGGIARYATDAVWLVPHFEKMLYDNAQFVSLLSRVYLRRPDDLFRIRIEETVAFVLRDMMTNQGAFAASYDADSDGEEGRYYVWSYCEIAETLPPELLDLFCQTYDVTPQGNWEGHTILNRSRSLDLLDPQTENRLAGARGLLLEMRKRRNPPGFDDKVLADWNGLMITALAEAALVSGRADWAESATQAMDCVMSLLWQDGRLRHSYRQGRARHEATAEGYANLITAALALHALTGHTNHVATAERLAAALIEHFWDKTRGGLFFASKLAEHLIIRPHNAHDDATPNANGVMLANFAALHLLTGKADYRDRAEAILGAFGGQAQSNTFAAPTLLRNSLYLSDPIAVVAAGKPALEFWKKALPSIGLDIIFQAVAEDTQLPPGHPATGKAVGTSAVYICRGQTCALPATTPEELTRALELVGLAPPASGIH